MLTRCSTTIRVTWVRVYSNYLHPASRQHATLAWNTWLDINTAHRTCTCGIPTNHVHGTGITRARSWVPAPSPSPDPWSSGSSVRRTPPKFGEVVLHLWELLPLYPGFGRLGGVERDAHSETLSYCQPLAPWLSELRISWNRRAVYWENMLYKCR